MRSWESQFWCGVGSNDGFVTRPGSAVSNVTPKVIVKLNSYHLLLVHKTAVLWKKKNANKYLCTLCTLGSLILLQLRGDIGRLELWQIPS